MLWNQTSCKVSCECCQHYGCPQLGAFWLPLVRRTKLRHRAGVNSNIVPDWSRESLTSTEEPAQATSTQLPASALALLLRQMKTDFPSD